MALETLKKIPALAKLKDSEISQLVEKLDAQSFDVHHDIIKQGDEGEGFYIIAKGECVVTRLQDCNDPTSSFELGRLKAGDYFGEAALQQNAKRGATVTALTNVDCFYLSRQDFSDMFTSQKIHVQFAKRKAVRGENVKETTYSPAIPIGATKEKNAETRAMILEAIKFNVLFMNLSAQDLNSIIDEMYLSSIKTGVSCIVQGDYGDNFYIVNSGEFYVFVNETCVAIRSRGMCFGELALMYNAPRAATVTAMEDSEVWVVDRFTFKRVVVGVTQEKLANYMDFLQSVPVLSALATFEREKIAEALEEVHFRKDDVVCNQGDDGNEMFIVQSGELVVKIKANGTSKEVARVKAGEYFGERALIKNAPRAATVTAVTDCVLLKLDRNAFALLLGPLEDILQQRVESYDAKKSEPVTELHEIIGGLKSTIEFKDLQVLGTLGTGSFGHVQLVRDTKGGKTYALKAVWKAQIVETNQQGHILSEKRAMAAFSHPFLVGLYNTYKTQDRLYFLLEPALGGELFRVLREKVLLDEDTSRFYAAHIVLAFEYMHSLDYVYRDLKPENLLLDSTGYLKLTDFGFAKNITSGRTWTLCGTPDYLAPEIVTGKGHGKGVDWWTLGIFIFEVLASFPPFYDEDPMKKYAKIINGVITFPPHFSPDAVNLIKKLLYHKPTRRLGVVNGGARLIKKQAWFKSFNWEHLLERKLKAPFVPNISSDADLSNFDDYGEDQEHRYYEDDGTNWEEDF